MLAACTLRQNSNNGGMTLRAAVLGHPIAHSLSPRLHGYWLQQLGINGQYEAIDTPPQDLADRLTQLQQAGYRGVNLTVPLKEAVLPLLSHLSPQAQRMGAVNTITFHANGLRGENTDAYGFIANVQHEVESLKPYLSHAVVLGAGGAARAVLCGLLDAGVQRITLSNRTRHKAEALQALDAASIQIIDWEQREAALCDASLLVNTTALGMQGKAALELSLDALPVSALVTDIVYAPLHTPLLQQAQARGNRIVTGLGMLVHQAVPAFEAFFGQRPVVDAFVYEALA